ncbi:2-amino-4-hydroxy-6-hydroxymethyldihydropteridine diphosphokinase [Flavobacterium litorale]|uniref:2-amino-4-hydroxy-6-hydroxymethyldihydropteridine pyrophosphokinase n=1 Tax=Flavobacterium litorale TaxID=2856519 RepID=A0ABX8V707_9FLAO|nr:2-amino-4-hydroxy-6-hydroxymethyldihydropteridine diphosphokinase [Flavobacterium litorale]QYJ68625.1 2-amino-4-hydroxy-6-hydroxymethyldihydropteridine diphosphokinase [Flavobacterium litorale]
MKFQNQVILSIGSNQGNRQEHITSAIFCIHNTIATVVQVSALYETPAWGFESDDFYNCAIIVHTHKTPQVLLEALLAAEQVAGRTRQAGKGYQARSIDIDVIAFNDAILTTDTLTIPHPRMHERNFVLYPLRDVAPRWEHPVTHKTIDALIANSPDGSTCKKVAELIPPLQAYNLKNLNYLAIEGNIGAGKTTLSGTIAEDFNAKLVLERFADNPFLPKFYNDQSRYAFSLEMAFLADRYHQLSDDLAQFDLFRDFVVADYHIFKSLIFAKVTLNEDEYRLYRKLFDIIYKEMPKPDLYVYLYQNTDRLLHHIKKRGRDYEQNITPEYLEKINKGYLDYINAQPNLNVLLLDVSDRDFVRNQEDYIWILNQIQAKLQ